MSASGLPFLSLTANVTRGAAAGRPALHPGDAEAEPAEQARLLRQHISAAYHIEIEVGVGDVARSAVVVRQLRQIGVPGRTKSAAAGSA